MKTALDTNILSALWSTEPSAIIVSEELPKAQRDGAVVISLFTYAESCAHPIVTVDTLQLFLSASRIEVDEALSKDVWSLAGTRFRKYAERRRVETGVLPRRILADFLIGAHATLHADRLMTLDERFYRTNFPELRMYPLPL